MTLFSFYFIVFDRLLGKQSNIDLQNVNTMSFNESDYQSKVAKLPKNDLKNLYIISNVSENPIPITVAFGNYMEIDPYRDDWSDFILNLLVYEDYESALARNMTPGGSSTFASYVNNSEKIENDLVTYYYEKAGERKLYDYAFFNAYVEGYSLIDYRTNLYREYGAYGDIRDIANGFLTFGAIESFSKPYMDGEELISDRRYTDTRYIYLTYDNSVCDVSFKYCDTDGVYKYIYKTYEYGAAIGTFPEIPTEVLGGKFLAWGFEYANSGTIDVDYKVVKNLELKAYYDFVYYTIELYAYNEDLQYYRADKQKVSSAEYLKVLNSYDMEFKKGSKTTTAIFIGWSLESGNRKKIIDLSTYRFTNDTRLYAIYNVKTIDSNNIWSVIGNAFVSIWNFISKAWEIIGSVPFIGSILQVIVIILLLPLLIALVRLLITLFKAIFNLIKNLVLLIKSIFKRKKGDKKNV